MQKKQFSIIYILLVVSFFASGTYSQEVEQDYVATTISDPQIPVGDLELLLKPLTKSELIVEAEAWLQLLKSKVSQISAAEIQMRQKAREIDQKEEEIEKKIEQIEETEKQVEEKEKVAAEAEKEIEEKVEAIDQAESEIDEITIQTQAELESKPEEELSSLAEDLQEKTEEVIEAREKVKDTVEEIAQTDMELTEKVNGAEGQRRRCRRI
jgi:small conductance mechanosensitive channel